jgi:hypothetical protein
MHIICALRELVDGMSKTPTACKGREQPVDSMVLLIGPQLGYTLFGIGSVKQYVDVAGLRRPQKPLHHGHVGTNPNVIIQPRN